MTTKKTEAEIMKEFERPDVYKIRFEMDGFSYRFVRERDIERRKDEGFITVEGEEAKKCKPRLSAAGSPDGLVRAGGSHGAVLMKIPIKVKRRRDKYFEELHSKSWLNKVKGDMAKEADNVNRQAGVKLVSGIEVNDELEKV